MIISFKEADSEYPFNIDVPDICPRCGRDLVPKPLYFEYLSHVGAYYYYTATVLCPQCKKPIYLDISVPESTHNTYCGKVNSFFPSNKILDLPSGIGNLYPDFCRIYNQAALSEARGLSEICGMGYRRALEMLVKQYALKAFPGNTDAINNEKLMQTINRIENPRIQALAQASAWIGNDQTHLQVKHPEYTVVDIKAFIKSLCYYILMEEEVIRAQALINKPRQ